jgi:hypothetical protein
LQGFTPPLDVSSSPSNHAGHNTSFGALEVDLEVPDHLKEKFAEMPPVFKNTHIFRDDI